jgi:hypothetical protein
MALSEQITINRQLGEIICHRLFEEINKLGFTASDIPHFPNYDKASFALIKDPFTGQHNLTCRWYNPHNRQPIGSLQFNSDGTFYAEYDVVKIHPGKPKWFVESVTAWGNAANIKSEAKLLPLHSN